MLLLPFYSFIYILTAKKTQCAQKQQMEIHSGFDRLIHTQSLMQLDHINSEKSCHCLLTILHIIWIMQGCIQAE